MNHRQSIVCVCASEEKVFAKIQDKKEREEEREREEGSEGVKSARTLFISGSWQVNITDSHSSSMFFTSLAKSNDFV